MYDYDDVDPQAERVAKVDKCRRAYQAVFEDCPEAELVIDDLKRFCRIGETDMDPERTHSMAVLMGRQQVFYRIASALSITDGQIMKLREELR